MYILIDVLECKYLMNSLNILSRLKKKDMTRNAAFKIICLSIIIKSHIYMYIVNMCIIIIIHLATHPSISLSIHISSIN